jgi:predicted site-specific integrase-resolvase
MLRNDSVDFLSIGQAARLLSLSTVTLRAYERASKISAYYTPGGTRRYRYRELIDELGFSKEPTEKIEGRRHSTYCRTSSASQKSSLIKQRARMISLVAERESIPEENVLEFSDNCSSFGQRDALNQLCLAIVRGEIASCTVQCKDRISRDSVHYLVSFLCKAFDTRLLCLDREEKDPNQLEDQLKDLCDWISCWQNKKQARLQASRRIKQLDGPGVEKVRLLHTQGVCIDAIVRYLNDNGFKVDGKPGLIPRRAVTRYIAALEKTLSEKELTEGNTVWQFCKVHVFKKEGERFLGKDLRVKYVKWATKNGFIPLTKQQVGRVLLELYGKHRKQYCGFACFHDLRLRD